MARTLEYAPLVRWKSGIHGLIAGSLVTSGILSGFGLPAQIIIIIVGVFSFVDSLIPDGEDTSPMTTIGFTILGTVISLGGVVYGFLLPWSVLMAVVTVGFYFYKFSRKRKK